MLAFGQHVDLVGERCVECALLDSESARSNVDLAQRRNGKESARRETFEERPVQKTVPEQVTEDEIDRRTVGKAAVEIDHIELTAGANAELLCQCLRLADSQRGDVEAPHVDASTCEPHRSSPSPACDLECVSGGRKEVLMRCERRRRGDVWGC